MRLDEMCGLRTEDVIGDQGITYFDLKPHEGRRLKTAAARRCVPVHSELLGLGFDSYLAHVKDQKHNYLFPALKPGGPDKKRSWYVSKRFTTYRRSVGVGASETVFHSFRKCAATALERAHVPENEAMEVLGHHKATTTYGLYSGGLGLEGLARSSRRSPILTRPVGPSRAGPRATDARQRRRVRCPLKSHASRMRPTGR